MFGRLGLLPLVKKLQFRDGHSSGPWFVPGIFDSQSLRYLSAFVNLQDLTVDNLDLSGFEVGLEKFFGHFSPTLQSLSLNCPRGPARRLLDFLGLFPKLDDIEIVSYRAALEAQTAPDIPRASIVGSLQGRLKLHSLIAEGLLGEIITVSGGIRFIYMELGGVSETQLLLDACAETLQTLRLHPNGKRFSKRTPWDLN